MAMGSCHLLKDGFPCGRDTTNKDLFTAYKLTQIMDETTCVPDIGHHANLLDFFLMTSLVFLLCNLKCDPYHTLYQRSMPNQENPLVSHFINTPGLTGIASNLSLLIILAI